MDQPVFNIGEATAYQSTPVPFALTLEEARRHLYIIGKTGTGKTSLLRSIAIQLIQGGHGVGVIDPHGDLAEALLDYVPPRERNEHVVYFNPADVEHPVGFNPLWNIPSQDRHKVAEGLVSSFKSIWRDSWGPRMEYILGNSLASLLECQNVTLLALPRLLTEPRYRAWVIKQVSDPMLRRFWLDEFEEWDARFQKEAVAPILNKVGAFTNSPPIRNILGQVKRKIDPRFMMDNGRIFIANLSKGALGESSSNLIGSLLVSQFQIAALARTNIPEVERRDFFLIVDEAHNFTSDSFASILSEARKYRLCLILAHQYHEQLSPEIRAAVFGNVNTLISFRVGSKDAEALAAEFGTDATAEHFRTLGLHQSFVRPPSSEQLYRVDSTPTSLPRYNRSESLIRLSRSKFATPRVGVETRIERWLAK